MTDMYQLIDDLLESDKLDNEAALNSIWRKAGRNNLSINVVDRVANSVLYTEQEEKGPLFTRLFGYIIGENQKQRKHAGIVGYVRGIQTETGFRQ